MRFPYVLVFCAVWYSSFAPLAAQNLSDTTQPRAAASSSSMPDYITNPSYILTGFGLYGAVEGLRHNAQFSSFTGLPICCPDNFGTQDVLGGWNAGIVFDHNISPALMLDVRLGMASYRVQFSRTEGPIIVGIQGNPTPLFVEHRLGAQLTRFFVEPALKLRLLPFPISTTYAPSLYLQAGINVTYWHERLVSYAERILSDSVHFLVNGQVASTRNAFVAGLNSAPQLAFTPFVGLETDIFLESLYPAHWLLTPYVRVYPLSLTVMGQGDGTLTTGQLVGTINGVQSSGYWSIAGSVQLGIALKYRSFTLVKP